MQITGPTLQNSPLPPLSRSLCLTLSGSLYFSFSFFMSHSIWIPLLLFLLLYVSLYLDPSISLSPSLCLTLSVTPSLLLPPSPHSIALSALSVVLVLVLTLSHILLSVCLGQFLLVTRYVSPPPLYPNLCPMPPASPSYR